MCVQVETSEVQIPDFDYDTITCMLQYMYGCLELGPTNLSHPKVRLACYRLSSHESICVAISTSLGVTTPKLGLRVVQSFQP